MSAFSPKRTSSRNLVEPVGVNVASALPAADWQLGDSLGRSKIRPQFLGVAGATDNKMRLIELSFLSRSSAAFKIGWGTFSLGTHIPAVTFEQRMKISSLLTAACIAALFSVAAAAQPGEGRSSCTSEAFRVCWRAMPDRPSVFLCLVDNRRTLNEPCRSTMMREAQLRMHHGVMDRSPRPRNE